MKQKREFVVYSVFNKPRIGIKQRDEHNKIIISPLKRGNIVKRDICEVIFVDDIIRLLGDKK